MLVCSSAATNCFTLREGIVNPSPHVKLYMHAPRSSLLIPGSECIRVAGGGEEWGGALAKQERRRKGHGSFSCQSVSAHGQGDILLLWKMHFL